MFLSATQEPYKGFIELSYNRASDQEGKTLDLDIEIRMANIILKRLWGTTVLDPNEEDLKPAKNRLYKIFDLHRKNFPSQVDSVGNEERGYRLVLQDRETMVHYGTGEPWSNEKIVRTLALDAYRPSARAANALIPEEKCPRFLDEATPWTGYAVYPKNEKRVIGRAANGASSDPERSESGLVIHKNYWGQGFGHQAEIALYVHAYVFSKLGFKLQSEKGNHDIKMFSGTVPPSHDAKIKQLGLRVLIESDFPFGPDRERRLVGVPTNHLPYMLDKLMLKDGIEHQITINGKNPLEFFREAGV